MERDIRGTAIYQEAEALFHSLRRPGSGQISDAAEIHASPCGRRAIFAGSLTEKLEGTPSTRICQVELAIGEIRVLTFGPNTDRLPKYSPTGCCFAFLSDRHRPGDFQLYLFDLVSGAVRSTPRVDGWVEYAHWSPDGRRILLGVAGHGADISAGQGAIASKRAVADVPSWVPDVQTGEESYRRRHAWVYDVATEEVRQVSRPDTNIWEANWCGNDAIAVISSPGAAEGEWYAAHLRLIATDFASSRGLYTPRAQLGWPAASPSGRHLAIVEGLCSDRWVVAGELRLIDTGSGEVLPVETHGVDITYAEWRSDQTLLLAGHHGFETVVGRYEPASGVFTELWRSRELTTVGRYASVSGFTEEGDCVLIGESYLRAPEVAIIRQGEYRPVKSFDLGYAHHAEAIHAAESVTWTTPDGLEIQGWLLRPGTEAPFPLIMSVHGGPVWHWRPTWLGRRGAMYLMLLKRGYAIFFPNPRGSAGRGQHFVRHVLGDMGGADTVDFLSGLDHLVSRGVADPARLGVTGASYGGFMTSWLITQDSRFAAAVPVAPVTNYVSQHLISNIPDFVALFLGDRYTNREGKYFARSPIMHAHKAVTPTLNICGALDRCTPPEEAMQFHNALLENDVHSVLVTYPEEGHGVRQLPAAIDFAARVVAWFDEHLSVVSEATDIT